MDKDLIAGLIIIVIVLLIALTQPFFEMQAFNKFSKEKATYFDALFSELRINAR